MIHLFNKGSNDYTLLLLHGTGGDESDLLPIANIIDNEANVLSVRGNIQENGMNRFFRRLSPGVFDLEDLDYRSKELYDFINEASIKYGFNRSKVIAIGYSNGANIASNMVMTIKDAFVGAILLRPMMPRSDKDFVNNDRTKVLIVAGTFDSICPPSEAKELAEHLTSKNNEVKLAWINANHRLTYDELFIVRDWYHKSFK